jgi:hypothetical protein
MKKIVLFIALGFSALTYAKSKLPPCNDNFTGPCHAIQKYSNGGSYDGEWLNGKAHGKGFQIFSDGDRFIGHYSNNQLYGHGAYFFKDGRWIVGQWKDGILNGKAINYYSNGTIKEQGLFENGELIKSEKVKDNYAKKIIEYNERKAEVDNCIAREKKRREENLRKVANVTFQFKQCVIENARDNGGPLSEIFDFLITTKIREIAFDQDNKTIKAEVNWKNEFGGFTGWIDSIGTFKQSEKSKEYLQIQSIKVGNENFKCRVIIGGSLPAPYSCRLSPVDLSWSLLYDE